jgi:hypothetical protein
MVELLPLRGYGRFGSNWHSFSLNWQPAWHTLKKIYAWRFTMPIDSDSLFLLIVTFLFCHELDAIRHYEWRLFAFINRLDDDTAYAVFAILHMPLFGLFLWFTAHPATWFFIAVDSFAIVHMGLHWWFRTHPRYEFRGFVSNLFIAGAAVSGALHLFLLLFF